MQINSLLPLFLLFCFSCKNKSDQNSQEKFDKVKWSIKYGTKYPYRDKMLNHLVYNIKLKGFKKDSVLNLLGEPNRTDTNYLFYTVAQQFLGDGIPLHTKTLVIKFANDTVEWRKIHE
jgi:hypothetical protein